MIDLLNNDMYGMSKVIVYTFFILVAGFVLWRLAVGFSRKKSKPKEGRFFKSKYRDYWNEKE